MPPVGSVVGGSRSLTVASSRPVSAAVRPSGAQSAASASAVPPRSQWTRIEVTPKLPILRVSRLRLDRRSVRSAHRDPGMTGREPYPGSVRTTE